MIYKFKKLAYSLLPLLVMSLLISVPVKANDDYSCTIAIPIAVKVAGENAPTGTEFNIVLESVEDGNPMPEQTRVVICDTDEASFGPITYTKPGDYQYKIYQEKGNAEHFIYDEAVFTVTVRVTNDGAGGLAATIWAIKDGEENKVDEVVFVNEYKKPTPVVETGDNANVILWVSVLAASALCLLIVFIKRHRRNFKEQ